MNKDWSKNLLTIIVFWGVLLSFCALISCFASSAMKGAESGPVTPNAFAFLAIAMAMGIIGNIFISPLLKKILGGG